MLEIPLVAALTLLAKVLELASDMLEVMVVVLAFFADVTDVDEWDATDVEPIVIAVFVVPTADVVCSTTVESVIQSTPPKTI